MYAVIPTKVEVREAPGRGRGVFATTAIPKGELIEMSPALVSSRADQKYIIRSFLKDHFFCSPKGEVLVSVGYGTLYNHADEPNMQIKVGEEAIWFFALRDIKAGEELTHDYGWPDSKWASVGGKKC